jgi:hypothetical protein
LNILNISRQSLLLSSTLNNVDLIYNGMSDKYETLYPYLEAATNEGGMKLLTKEELGDKQVKIILEFRKLLKNHI